MESQGSQNTSPDAQQNATGEQPAPGIRTMQSDITEYVKREKPSLIQILTKQAECKPEEPADNERKRSLTIPPMVLAGTVVLVLMSIAGFGMYWYFSQPATEPSSPETQSLAVPQPLITVEKTETHVIAESAAGLRQILNTTSQNREQLGSLMRLVLEKKNNAGVLSLFTTEEIFNILGVLPPAQITDSLTDKPFIAVYFSNEGPRTIFAAESRGLDRTFTGMLNWESAIQRDWETFFLGKPFTPRIAPFMDKTFSNLDYRFMEFEPGFGIGYFVFPPKNILVIATSEETIHTAISRLLEAR